MSARHALVSSATPKRAAIAAAISKAHSEATGAPSFLVQVIFDEKEPGRRYLGGAAVDHHVWINGDIRGGRTTETRTRLIVTVMAEVARIMRLPEREIWLYLNELEPNDMIEYGHVLPAAGAEQAWFDALPRGLQDYLTSLGASGQNLSRR